MPPEREVAVIGRSLDGGACGVKPPTPPRMAPAGTVCGRSNAAAGAKAGGVSTAVRWKVVLGVEAPGSVGSRDGDGGGPRFARGLTGLVGETAAFCGGDCCPPCSSNHFSALLYQTCAFGLNARGGLNPAAGRRALAGC